MRTLVVLRAAALLLLALVGLRGTPAGADEEGEEEGEEESAEAAPEDLSAPWLAQATYEPVGDLHSGEIVFHVWRLAGEGWPEPTGDPTEAPLVTLLRDEQGAIREAYDFSRQAAEDGNHLLIIRRRVGAEETTGSRIAEAHTALDATGLELASSFAGRLLEVEARWLAGARRLAEAAQAQQDPDDESARGLLKDAARILGRAHQAAPWHLGVVCDLIATYQLLLPYEVGSDRGANISFLWREACRQWLEGAPTEEEIARATLCELSCTFTEGCYPLAAELTEHPLLREREDLEPLKRALLALGQTEREVAERVSLSGPRGALDLLAITCPSQPRTAGLPWHRRVYLTYATGSEGPPLPVWFSLSLEGEARARRWALVGWVGSSRRVLRLYGAEEPASAEVDAYVTSLIQGTADAEATR